MFLNILSQAIRFATVFLFGSTGETITEKGGHLNLGIPGIMCIGAMGGCLGVKWYIDSVSDLSQMNGFLAVFIPILTCMLFAGLAGLVFAFFAVTLKCNQNVTGLTITTFGIGLNRFVLGRVENTGFPQVSEFFKQTFSFAQDNWFTQLFFSYGSLVYIAIFVSILTAIFIKRTRTGLNLRAVGENPGTADAAGINVAKYRYMSTIIGCAIAGLGGLFYVMDKSSGNIEYYIDQYGWMAVALVIFSIWKPNWGIIGSFVFALLYLLPNAISIQNPAQKELIKLLPYFMTIIVLIITSLVSRRETQPPASLGMTYFREDR